MINNKTDQSLFREACVCSLEEALSAQDKGADRVELCESIEVDGLTPSIELVDKVFERISIPIRIMIRPRAGNFHYNSEEIKIILDQIDQIKSYPIDGIVFGCLNERQFPDLNLLHQIEASFPNLKITFHKAIDQCPDILLAVEQIKSAQNVDYILSSGGAETAQKGAPILKEMHEKANSKIQIMAGGKVTLANLSDLVSRTGLRSFHGRRIY